MFSVFQLKQPVTTTTPSDVAVPVPPPQTQYRLPTCREYFRDLFYRVEVNFVDKNIPNDGGFILTLSQRTQFDQVVEAVAKHLEVDKTHLQFFKSANYRYTKGFILYLSVPFSQAHSHCLLNATRCHQYFRSEQTFLVPEVLMSFLKLAFWRERKVETFACDFLWQSLD